MTSSCSQNNEISSIWLVANDSSRRLHSRRFTYGLGSDNTVETNRKAVSDAGDNSVARSGGGGTGTESFGDLVVGLESGGMMCVYIGG
ncbi:hypothetical protein HanIR_Chr07g0337151 [Helianthus annuus]|nr:hypothetical protein HanIR_Chr07g0337151 [Helianthus annuus]